MKKILVLLGPTSSGKSDIAIKLAKKFDGEIISADSRQIFRGLDIGTGKTERDKSPKKQSPGLRIYPKSRTWMSQKIPHYMIDIVSPRTEYNVAKFKRQAEEIIEDILKRKKLPVICGGTGFWIKAIVDNVNFPEVRPDWKLRNKLEKYPTEKLFAMLKKLDPARAKTIDPKNNVRLIRSIEIATLLGKVPTLSNSKLVIRNSDRKNPNYQLPITNYNFLQIGIKLPKENLYENIEKRVTDRIRQGMIGEVKNLHTKDKLSWKKIQSFGLAYFWIPLYLQNKLTQKELVEKVTQAEKNYAKRQMTWFKRDKRIKWLKSYKEIEKATKDFLK